MSIFSNFLCDGIRFSFKQWSKKRQFSCWIIFRNVTDAAICYSRILSGPHFVPTSGRQKAPHRPRQCVQYQISTQPEGKKITTLTVGNYFENGKFQSWFYFLIYLISRVVHALKIADFIELTPQWRFKFCIKIQIIFGQVFENTIKF